MLWLSKYCFSIVLVFQQDFEGMGSLLHGIAEAAAEAFWSRRVLIWGPPTVAPLLLQNVSAGLAGAPIDEFENLASPLEVYFEPLSPCR